MDLFDEMIQDFCEYEREAEETKKDLLLAYKVINEMAEHMAKLDVDEDICKNIEHCASDKKLCRDCIKEYFYKKVE